MFYKKGEVAVNGMRDFGSVLNRPQASDFICSRQRRSQKLASCSRKKSNWNT